MNGKKIGEFVPQLTSKQTTGSNLQVFFSSHGLPFPPQTRSRYLYSFHVHILQHFFGAVF